MYIQLAWQYACDNETEKHQILALCCLTKDSTQLCLELQVLAKTCTYNAILKYKTTTKKTLFKRV